MRKLILVLLFILISFTVFPQGREMSFWVYGMDIEASQKYEGLFETPRFEYMGGVFGDYVYVVTLITKVNGNDYYCVGLLTSTWFNEVVRKNGYLTVKVEDNRVYLSYLSVPLMKIPFEGKVNE